MPITGSVNPRIRHLLLTLAFAVGLLPTAEAVAASPMASAFSNPSTCVSASGPYAMPGITDDIPPAASGWQKSVPLAGTGVDNWEWKVDCGSTQTATSGNITIVGDGTHTLSHRAQTTGGGAWTPWVDDTIKIDTGIPTNTSTPATGWVRSPYNFNVTGTDTLSPVSYEYRDGGSGPFTPAPGGVATVTGTGTHTFYTATVDAAGNRNERSDSIKVDGTAPSDNTTAPTGWQHNTVDITVAGADAESGLAYV